MRLQGVRVDGEPTAPAEVKPAKLKSKEHGAVTVSLTGQPTYSGEEALRTAIDLRHGIDLVLEFDDGPKLKGHFRVNRMDHLGGGIDREYAIVLESCPKDDGSSD
jgi:hypothetical protein